MNTTHTADDATAAQAALLSHPVVERALVVVRKDASGQTRLLGFFVPRPEAIAKTEEASRAASVEQWVREWQARWNRLYDASTDDAPDFSGWNEPAAEMQEWVENAVRRIQSLQPQNVLDVGCGLGLLLERLAPPCRSYHGTDISARAIARLRGWLQSRPDLAHVQISHTSATDIDRRAIEACDIIVLNSVVQYFPDMRYLLDVLERLAREGCSLRHMFVGDVWNLHLKPVFHCAACLYSVPDELPTALLREHLARVVEEDKELYVAPEFWSELAATHTVIRHAEVALKRGRARNQMTLYRYDVVLGTEAKRETRVEKVLCWSERRHSVSEIRSLLEQTCPASLSVLGIANKRVAKIAAAYELIASGGRDRTMRDVREQLRTLDIDGQEPEDFWELGESTGYDVSVSWTPGSRDGRFDVTFKDSLQVTDAVLPERTRRERRPELLRTSDPFRAWQRRKLAAEVREYLRSVLPVHWVPTVLMSVSELPPVTSCTSTAPGRTQPSVRSE